SRVTVVNVDILIVSPGVGEIRSNFCLEHGAWGIEILSSERFVICIDECICYSQIEVFCDIKAVAYGYDCSTFHHKVAQDRNGFLCRQSAPSFTVWGRDIFRCGVIEVWPIAYSGTALQAWDGTAR